MVVLQGCKEPAISAGFAVFGTPQAPAKYSLTRFSPFQPQIKRYVFIHLHNFLSKLPWPTLGSDPTEKAATLKASTHRNWHPCRVHSGRVQPRRGTAEVMGCDKRSLAYDDRCPSHSRFHTSRLHAPSPEPSLVRYYMHCSSAALPRRLDRSASPHL